MARGPKPINWKEVEFAMMCSENQDEIAASQGLGRDAFRERFKREYGVDYYAYSAQLHKKGNILLREAQMKSALKGNSNMQMYLGQVRLGQVKAESKTTPINDSSLSDQHEIMRLRYLLEKHNIDPGTPIPASMQQSQSDQLDNDKLPYTDDSTDDDNDETDDDDNDQSETEPKFL